MRYTLAVISFLLAIVAMLIGIGQRTIWIGPDSHTEQVNIPQGSSVVVIDYDVQQAHPDSTLIQAEASGNSLIAVIGKTRDMKDWLFDQQYVRVSHSPRTDVMMTRVVVEKKYDAEDPAELISPLGSDLWLDEYTGENKLSYFGQLQEDYSIMFVTEQDTPGTITTVSFTWDLTVSTPWVGPLFVLAALLMVFGVIMWLTEYLRRRKRRGPQRKQSELTRQKKEISRQQKTRAIESSGKRGRRKARSITLVGVSITAALVFTGCSQEMWPKFSSPDEIEDVELLPTPPKNQQDVEQKPVETYIPQPSLSVNQYERVIARIADAVEEADAERDTELAGERLGMGALEVRKAAYKIQKANKDAELPAGVDPDSVKVFLPQQTEGWPRSFFIVTDVPTGEKKYPQLQYFIQQSARHNYQLVYQVNLFHDMPEVAAASLGGATVPNDTKLLPLSKQEIFETYAKILAEGDKADPDGLFEKEGDVLRESFGKEYKDKRIKDMPKYSSLKFSSHVNTENVVGFWTVDSGAILLGTITETETVTPSEKGAKVSPTGNAKILFGKDKSSTGIEAKYLQQVLLYVPPLTSEAPIQLIGYSQDLVSATEK